ncbi:circadian clock-controlled protein daywake-like [Temnothorax nylanderi]|uniref:circadian clock-controlled protein daywake-like n=1 Tax=Temnothorax nylanderi TaxID=102681 RepID=UPI003A868420
MSIYALSIFSIAIFRLSLAAESELPVTTCKRNMVDYSACLKHALEEAWPRFVKGLPEFDFPSLDPLFFKYGRIALNSNEIRIEIIVSNATGIGLANTRFFYVRTHYVNNVFRLEFDAQIPSIFLKGSLKINGTLNAFRLAGEGPFNVTVDDLRATWDFTGNVVNDTWIVEHFRFAIASLKNLKIYGDNLFEGNKELNNLILIFVNEYWPAIYRPLLPFISDFLDTSLVEFPNKIFSKVSFSKVFP